ncbi:hypothetical protein DAEQUDRAFT_740491 [Daedalea quercina L-15889]|uniref:Yeast cell wall synthesis Kre9/Knh1-like N-terminal domain-containing protein n=1 Tax=Daedalea quercina L-15889 TaxID=1314783 RepID=A0A165MHX4_9APHY|nr:hypothetical protein DAEQUDRAFT_740491 [Daedalea quercina L-15889]
MTKPHSSLFFLVSVASALVLDTPSGWYSGETVTERWQIQPSDPAQFNLELSSAGNNNNGNWDVANNVHTANGAVTFRLPNVPAGHYVLRAVDTTNEDKVYAESGQFNIAQ